MRKKRKKKGYKKKVWERERIKRKMEKIDLM